MTLHNIGNFDMCKWDLCSLVICSQSDVKGQSQSPHRQKKKSRLIMRLNVTTDVTGSSFTPFNVQFRLSTSCAF